MESSDRPYDDALAEALRKYVRMDNNRRAGIRTTPGDIAEAFQDATRALERYQQEAPKLRANLTKAADTLDAALDDDNQNFLGLSDAASEASSTLRAQLTALNVSPSVEYRTTVFAKATGLNVADVESHCEGAYGGIMLTTRNNSEVYVMTNSEADSYARGNIIDYINNYAEHPRVAEIVARNMAEQSGQTLDDTERAVWQMKPEQIWDRVGENQEKVLDQIIAECGRGQFIASYDNKEHQFGDLFFYVGDDHDNLRFPKIAVDAPKLKM